MFIMPPKKSGKKEFFWTDDEVELLLTVTQQYKVQQMAEGTSWESVKSKYADILQLFVSELPATEEEASQSVKDYKHRKVDVTKEILTTKLKAIRNKYRQVSFCKPIQIPSGSCCFNRCSIIHCRLLIPRRRVAMGGSFTVILICATEFGEEVQPRIRLALA